MAQLVVRQLEESVVQRLRERAARSGISMEEEHRRILREALREGRSGKKTFKELLLSMPEVGDDGLFKRRRSLGRRSQNI